MKLQKQGVMTHSQWNKPILEAIKLRKSQRSTTLASDSPTESQTPGQTNTSTDGSPPAAT
ncbi:hypothetical protein D3C85_316560 [compost metagenome]